MNLTQTAGVALVSIVIAVGLTACGSPDKPQVPTQASQADATTAKPADATITIDNLTFTSPPSVAPGATIAVKNSDGMEHSVTADKGRAFDVEIEGGETATFTAPTTPGTYDYHCSYHPSMHGQLIVK